MSILIYPYSQSSNSARLLAQAMQARRILVNRNERVSLGQNDILINWGNSNFSRTVIGGTIINKPEHVRKATDKLSTYTLLTANRIPTCEYTIDRTVASQWCRERYTVMGRDTASGSGGAGITVYLPSGSAPPALHKFYTKYFPHKVEIRVHCFKDAEPYIQRKAKRNEWREHYGHLPNANYIHSHDNGYIYVIHDTNPYGINYTPALTACDMALDALNLDFGAFDVLVKSNGQFQILEVNTAPGIEGNTIEVYKNRLNQHAHYYQH